MLKSRWAVILLGFAMGWLCLAPRGGVAFGQVAASHGPIYPPETGTGHPGAWKSAAPHRAPGGLAALAARVGARHGLPPGLLEAVIWSESRWHPTALGTNRNGSCDCGLGQVNVPHCNPLRVAELMTPDVNLHAAARILRASARACARRPGLVGCSRCPWFRYNAGSKGWCAQVFKWWR